MVQIKMKNQDFPKCQASEGREVQLGLHRGECSLCRHCSRHSSDGLQLKGGASSRWIQQNSQLCGYLWFYHLDPARYRELNLRDHEGASQSVCELA